MNRRDFLKLSVQVGASAAALAMFSAVPQLAPYPQAGIESEPRLWGDGIHDDSPWFRWKFKQMVQNGGGTINLPPGRFFLGQTVPLDGVSGLRVQGFGTTITRRQGWG